MLHSDLKNSQNLDLASAMALFVVIMGFIFLVEVTTPAHVTLSLTAIIVGLVWIIGHFVRKHRVLTHHH